MCCDDALIFNWFKGNNIFITVSNVLLLLNQLKIDKFSRKLEEPGSSVG